MAIRKWHFGGKMAIQWLSALVQRIFSANSDCFLYVRSDRLKVTSDQGLKQQKLPLQRHNEEKIFYELLGMPEVDILNKNTHHICDHCVVISWNKLVRIQSPKKLSFSNCSFSWIFKPRLRVLIESDRIIMAIILRQFVFSRYD